jgi:Fe-S-cluster containining protein
MVDTFYVHLEFKNKKRNCAINLPFLCTKCGVCCTLDDFLTAGEITAKPQDQPQVHDKVKTLHEDLGKMWEKNRAKYDQYIMQTPCPFLVDNSCSIYDIRPEGCKRFPNTTFGMLTQDCEALKRFKRMRAALKKGRTAKETYNRITKDGDHINPAKLNEKQYQTCVAKLRQAGITNAELDLFKKINEKTKSQV